MMRRHLFLFLAILSILLAACGPADEPAQAPAPTAMQSVPTESVAQPAGQEVESSAGQEESTQATLAPTEATVESAPAPVKDLGPDASLDLVFVQHALCTWDNYWCAVEAGIRQAAHDMQVNVSILGPDTFDLEQVVVLIGQAVSEQPDGIALTMTDADLFRTPVQQALDAGIPVVAYDTGAGPEEDGVDYLTFFGQDDYQGGYLSGLRLADAGGMKGVCINHQAGNPGLDARCEGFLSAMNVSGLPGDVLLVNDNAAESQAIIGDYYTANPDTDAFLTLGPNGANAFYAFMTAAGLSPGDLFHGTFDLNEEIAARLRDGTTMYAVDQQPFLQGYGAVQALVMANRYGILPATPVTSTGPAFIDANGLDFQPDPNRQVDLGLVQHARCDWDPFWCVVENGVAQAAREMSVNATVLGPDSFDLAAVAQLIDEAVAAQPDGLAVTVSNADLLRDSIQGALDAGIPVVAYDSGAGPLVDGVEYMTFLGQDDYQGGYQGGLELAEAGGSGGVCINHQAGNVGLDARCEGFLAAMAEKGIPGQVLAITSDPTESLGILNGFYGASPDTDIFLTLGPSGAEVFFQFVSGAGLEPGDLKHATFDLSEEIAARIKDGTTLFALDQQPFLQGYGAVQTLMLKTRYGITPVMPITPTGPGMVNATNIETVEALAGQYR